MSHAPGSKIVEITDANFETEVLKSDKPFLLDLAAEWCGPCKAIAPVLEDLAGEYDQQIRFGTLDIDNNPQVPTRFAVRSVPTLLMFDKGGVVGQLIGAHPRPKIVELLQQTL